MKHVECIRLLVFAGLILAGCGVASAQSTRISDKEPEPAPVPAAAADAAAPLAPSAHVTIARLIPVPPRVEPARNSGKGLGGPSFSARSAIATRWTINSPFGVRHDPMTGVPRMHTGVDLQGSYGESVGASMSGTVAFAGQRTGYGNLVVIDHGHGISTYYAHLSEFAVAAGTPVEAGQVVGYVGTTGRSTGPHLHYEVRANGRPLDPSTLISLDGDRLSIDGVAIAVEEAALPKAPESTSILVDLDAPATVIVNGDALQVDWE